MKRTESIDTTATDLPLAGGEAVSPTTTSTMDERRRRLVRGVMAAAPLVLTLRSGALAAASCTGTKINPGVAATDGRARIRTGGTGGAFVTSGLNAFNDNASTADYCVKSVDSCSIPELAAAGKIDTHDANEMQVAVYRTGTGTGTRYYCGAPTGSPVHGDAAFNLQATNFAILSNGAHTSLMNG